MLAQHGLHVDAVNISAYGLHLAWQRAQPAGWPIQGIVADVERPWLPHRQYQVILISFFLHRPLFALIRQRLQPGGWLVYETFTTAQLRPSNNQPMRRDFLLEPGELQATFADFKILFYDEGEHARSVTAQLLAQKPN
jgi:SAM-dependent methyltransferase